MITVSELTVYPLKSARGTSVDTVQVTRMGFKHDRQWMVVSGTGMFVSQRSDAGRGIGIPSMCMIAPLITDTQLILRAPDMENLILPLAGYNGETTQVQIWNDHVEAVDQGVDAAIWLTKFLSRQRVGVYRLVRMPNDGVREAKHGDANVAFADADSCLIISQASLDDLNHRLAEPLPMNRFRPNLVLDSCVPYEEDRMSRIAVGGIKLVGGTLCKRCPIPATNQLTGQRGFEPTKTLRTYRLRGQDVVFGRNFNHSSEGTISVGDAVQILEWD